MHNSGGIERALDRFGAEGHGQLRAGVIDALGNLFSPPDAIGARFRLVRAQYLPEIARLVRARHPQMPIIFTTGQPDRMQGWTIGPLDHFVAKPYRPFAITALIRELLHNRA